jgi:hypothetical protein
MRGTVGTVGGLIRATYTQPRQSNHGRTIVHIDLQDGAFLSAEITRQG